jgi:uncharacterized protein (TIGR02266 family)
VNQDTRKDRRSKDVNLVVRYKSATVDEFIEQHSYDVSRGGLFIKTSKPFAPGTLLKFELRLSGDAQLISGVGRVVWKRESAQADGAERPAGMGVKFIKIEDAARKLIESVIAGRGGKSGQFDTEREEALPSLPPDSLSIPTGTQSNPPLTLASSNPPTAKADSIRVSAAPRAPVISEPAPKPDSLGPSGGEKPSGAPRQTFAARKLQASTMIGVGTPAPGSTASAPPAMFPENKPKNSTPSIPPKAERAEPTMMRQASELLEEALREAGGSLEEIGANPLFEQIKIKEPQKAAALGQLATEKSDSDSKAAKPGESFAGEDALLDALVDAPKSSEKSGSDGIQSLLQSTLDESAAKPASAAKSIGAAVADAKGADLGFAKTVQADSPAVSIGLPTGAAARLKEESKPAVPAASASAPETKPVAKKSNGGAVAILALLVAAGGGFAAFKAGMFGGSTTTTGNPAATASAPPSTSVAQAATAANSMQITPTATSTESTTPTATAAAASAGTAETAPSGTATATPTVTATASATVTSAKAPEAPKWGGAPVTKPQAPTNAAPSAPEAPKATEVKVPEPEAPKTPEPPKPPEVKAPEAPEPPKPVAPNEP